MNAETLRSERFLSQEEYQETSVIGVKKSRGRLAGEEVGWGRAWVTSHILVNQSKELGFYLRGMGTFRGS